MLALPQDVGAVLLDRVPDLSFARDPRPREEAIHGADAHRHTSPGQSRLDLDQSDVSLLGKQQALDEVAVRLDTARVAVALVGLTTARPCSSARRRQRIALEMLTSNWAAAARQLMPPSIAATTRSRRSCESVRAIHAALLPPARSLNQNRACMGIPAGLECGETPKFRSPEMMGLPVESRFLWLTPKYPIIDLRDLASFRLPSEVVHYMRSSSSRLYR